jgi:hypothetical protein
MYDMPLRDYDPAIGLWVVQDPVIHHSQSPYSGFNGNPVVFADPSGGAGQAMIAKDFWGRALFDENGNYIRRDERQAIPGDIFGLAGGSSARDVARSEANRYVARGWKISGYDGDITLYTRNFFED